MASGGPVDDQGKNWQELVESLEFTLKAVEQERNELLTINRALELEIKVHKERADRWRDMCQWAYNRSRETLMLRPGFRGFKNERDNALSEINYKMGGALR